jgi:hypothetical protein
MKAVDSAVSPRDSWRNIAITLIDEGSSLGDYFRVADNSGPNVGDEHNEMIHDTLE